MIYGRFGDVVTVLRYATLDDVKRLDHRKPDKVDRAAVESQSYVVVRQEDGTEKICHQAYLRADAGAVEIARALGEVP